MCRMYSVVFFFFKQKTAYEMRMRDWSSDVCSSDLTFASGAALLPFIQANKVKPIGVSSDKPMSVFPDVPPISSIPELKDFVLVNWFGLFTTAGTPTAIIDKLNAATVKALNDPEVIKTLETQGAHPSPTKPADFGAFRTAH